MITSGFESRLLYTLEPSLGFVLSSPLLVEFAVVKTTTRGRKKIEIENLSNRQVTFSKHRGGLFKKASELCILSGAEVAIIVHSLGKRIFSFGYPSADSVVERFLSRDGEGEERRVTCPAAARTRDYNRHYSELCKELELEKKRREAIEEDKRAEGYGGPCAYHGEDVVWWDEQVDDLELEKLEQYAAVLNDLMKYVTMRADDLMLIQSSNSLPGGASALTLPNPDWDMAAAAGVAWNDLATFEYGNCFLPLGFGQGMSL